jgi:uncharacterized protein (TIGR01777 family)
MRVAVTGATGLIGTRLVATLEARGDEVTAISLRKGPPSPGDLAGRDAVVHLAGEPVAQRWTKGARERIRSSRELGTRGLVEAIAAADVRPTVLVSASGVGYYGSRGDEPLDEDAAPGEDFLAQVCVAWEREANAAAAHGVRVVTVRTGVVLARSGGALAKMLPPFRLGIGGPVAGGRQYLPWIHIDDLVGIYVAPIDDDAWSGPVNAAAPEPVTNAAFSKALGRALHRPAIAPVPALAIRALYGDMAEIVTEGQRALPRRALELGYTFTHPDLDEALADALRAATPS